MLRFRRPHSGITERGMAAGTLSASAVLSTEIKTKILGARCWGHPEHDSIPRVINGWWRGWHGARFRNANGNLYVEYPYWNGNRWNWNYNWLDNDWNDNEPAAPNRWPTCPLQRVFRKGRYISRYPAL